MCHFLYFNWFSQVPFKGLVVDFFTELLTFLVVGCSLIFHLSKHSEYLASVFALRPHLMSWLVLVVMILLNHHQRWRLVLSVSCRTSVMRRASGTVMAKSLTNLSSISGDFLTHLLSTVSIFATLLFSDSSTSFVTMPVNEWNYKKVKHVLKIKINLDSGNFISVLK